MKKLLVWGRGGHGRIVREAAELLGYTDIDTADDTDENKTWHRFFYPSLWDVHVAIGDNKARQEVSERIRDLGYNLVTIIHPRAFVSQSARIGAGTYVGPMATVLTNVVVGRGCIINTTASVDHDCKLADFVHIAPGAHLCGTVTVGERTLVAVGGVVVPKVTIGNDCILGASSALVETIEGNNLKLIGIPARKVD